MHAEHSEVELSVRRDCEAGDYQAAANAALLVYGKEILTFLRGRLRSQSDGDEVFSMFAEDLWKGLPGFTFRCSVRGWLYTLARNAANRYAVAPAQQGKRHTDLEEHPQLSQLVVRVRTETHQYQRTDVKSKARELRARLSDDDQLLLVLHVDRNLPWRELVLVLHEGKEELSDEELTREAARLRKRFERVKAELRELAVKEGLVK